MNNWLLKLLFFIAYISVYKVAHAAETRKVVAIVDTGMPMTEAVKPYLCNLTHYDVTGKGIADVHGHGTNVAGIITKHMNPKTHCILIIKWWHSEKIKQTNAELYKAVVDYTDILHKVRPDYVNLSLSGNSYLGVERNTLKGLLATGTIITVAAGNDSWDLNKVCNVFPACYDMSSSNFHVVGSWSKLMNRIDAFSNFGKVVTDYRPGTYVCGFDVCTGGTSQASAVMMSELVSK